MKRLFTTCLMLGISAFLASPASAQQSTTGPVPPPGIDRGLGRVPAGMQKVIPGVPAYIWQHGCGPTALGMVIGYWDGQGFGGLVPGDAFSQTAAVNAMIADDGGSPVCAGAALDHFRDYSCPLDFAPNPLTPDKSVYGGAHVDNCVADFMMTSRSAWSNYYGWSWFVHVAQAFTNYVDLVMPSAHPTAASYDFWSFGWDDYCLEIDAGRPVVLLVDSDSDGSTDHFVTGLGYYTDTVAWYGIHDTWDMQVHWYRWQPLAPGVPWGIYGVTTFNPDPSCVDADADGYGDPGHPENECAVDNCPTVYNPSQADADLDGIGDACCCVGIRGNANGDPLDKVNVADVTFLLAYFFGIPSGPSPGCPAEGNANGDPEGKVNVSDVSYLLEYMFGVPTGPAPKPCP